MRTETDPVDGTADSAAGTATGPRGLRHVAAASLVGTTIKWYDYFLFGTASALVFGEVGAPKRGLA